MHEAAFCTNLSRPLLPRGVTQFTIQSLFHCFEDEAIFRDASFFRRVLAHNSQERDATSTPGERRNHIAEPRPPGHHDDKPENIELDARLRARVELAYYTHLKFTLFTPFPLSADYNF